MCERLPQREAIPVSKPRVSNLHSIFQCRERVAGTHEPFADGEKRSYGARGERAEAVPVGLGKVERGARFALCARSMRGGAREAPRASEVKPCVLPRERVLSDGGRDGG